MTSGDSSDADRLHDALCTAWERLVAVLDGGRFERRDGYIWTICPPIPLPQFNGVWPSDDTAVRRLPAALAEIESLALPYSVQTRRGRTPAFEREAERLGLIPEMTIRGMVLDPAQLAELHVPKLRIVRVRTADGLAQALAIAAESFAAPPEVFAPLYDLAVAGIEGLAVYLGRVGDVDVTTAVGFRLGDALGIFNVATPEEHRGHGYGAAVTAHAVSEGIAAGAAFAYLQSSPLGHSVYRRLGFRDVEDYTLYTAPKAPVVEPV